MSWLLLSSLFLVGCTTDPSSSTVSSPSVDPPVGSATSRPFLHGTVLDPPLAPPTQTLRDTAGRAFSVAASSREQLTLLFFGYTHCPDVCPTTVRDLAEARGRLPSDLRDRVTVVVVTEDPERDKPAALRRWLDRFDPTFVGLIGGNVTSAAMLKQL
jgi:protein SCO1/2